MPNTLLEGLEVTRDQLLRQFMLAQGSERAEVLTRIMDLDEEIDEQKMS